MLKNILNLEGAQKLTKNEQKEINGGLKCQDEGCVLSYGLQTCYRRKCNGTVFDLTCCDQL